MKLPIIRIGNSKGIRLSKHILEAYDLKDSIELIMEEGRIILKPVTEPRQNWESAFVEMHENRDDELLIDDVFHDEDIQ